MVDKYGSDQQQLANSGGSVVSQDSAVLINGDSNGETALLFGPAALREIQAGVANGDFAISPADAEGTITADNALPYWTFTDTSSSGAITCALVADTASASGYVLRFTIAPGTTTGKSAKISRYVPVATSRNRSLVVYPEVFIVSNFSASAQIRITWSYVKADYTATGTGSSRSTTTSGSLAPTPSVALSVPSDAAYLYISIDAATTGTYTAGGSADLAEVLLITAPEALLISEKLTPASYAPALLQQENGVLKIQPATSMQVNTSTVVSGDFQVISNTTLSGNLTTTGYHDFQGLVVSQYDRGGSADTTTITTAGTYYALTNAEVSFDPKFTGQRWLLTFTAYASLNTTTIQYCFVRANVVSTANVNVVDLGFSRADNFGSSGRGATVSFTKVYVATAADVTAVTRKFKLYGTAQTTNGLTLSLAYTQMTAYPIG
jgi:hypothetical protein